MSIADGEPPHTQWSIVRRFRECGGSRAEIVICAILWLVIPGGTIVIAPYLTWRIARRVIGEKSR